MAFGSWFSWRNLDSFSVSSLRLDSMKNEFFGSRACSISSYIAKSSTRSSKSMILGELTMIRDLSSPS